MKVEIHSANTISSFPMLAVLFVGLQEFLVCPTNVSVSYVFHNCID